MLVVTLATIAGTIGLYVVVPKGFFPTEDTGYVLGITEAKTDIAFRRDGRAPAQGRRHRSRRSGGRLRQFDRRRRRPQFASAIAAACWWRSSRENERDKLAGHPGAAARERQCRCRHRDLLPADPEHQSRRQARPRASINTRCNPTIPTRSIASRRNCATRSRRSPGLLDVTTDLYIKNPQITIDVDREKSAVYGVTRRSGAPGALQRLRHAPGRHDLYAGERLPGHPGKHAGISEPSPNDLNRIYLKTTERHDGAAFGGDTQFVPIGRPAAGQPSGPAAGGDDLVQSRARTSRSARRSMRSRSSSARSACRPRSPPASRAPRRCSRIRCAGRAS